MSIGICLSGGGFRAALYGLGVLRYLAEAGLLPHVKAVSAVSGGSVAAAVLADRWPALKSQGYSLDAYLREIDAPFRDAVTEHNMRNAAVGRWALRRATFRGRSRGSAMGDTMVKHLLSAKMVTDLSPELQVILTSTDLTTGRAFRVSREFIGSWDFGYQPVPDTLSLGQAVAASAAVPLLFPPVYLRTHRMGLRKAPEVLSLVDGGVYDNLGLEWFQGWNSGRPDQARPVDYIIVVDASGPIVASQRVLSGWRAVNRVREIQYVQTRTTRIRWFVQELIADRLQGIYLVSKHDPPTFRLPDDSPMPSEYAAGALPRGFGLALASLRTDLDRFSLQEADLLRYQGYWSAHARMSAMASGLALQGTPAWQDYAGMSDTEAEKFLALLATGRKRRLRR